METEFSWNNHFFSFVYASMHFDATFRCARESLHLFAQIHGKHSSAREWSWLNKRPTGEKKKTATQIRAKTLFVSLYKLSRNAKAFTKYVSLMFTGDSKWNCLFKNTNNTPNPECQMTFGWTMNMVHVVSRTVTIRMKWKMRYFWSSRITTIWQ